MLKFKQKLPHQRRAGNGSSFWRWIFIAKEEYSAMTDFVALFSTPKKNRAVKQNSAHYQQRQPSNAENLDSLEITTGLNLYISKPNNFYLWGALASHTKFLLIGLFWICCFIRHSAANLGINYLIESTE